MKGFMRHSRTLLLACLAAAVVAQQAGSPAAREGTLEDAVVQGERERERAASAVGSARNPDVVTVRRKGRIIAELRMYQAVPQIRFRRESAARLPMQTAGLPTAFKGTALTVDGRTTFSSATLEVATGTVEMDGLPAALHFGTRSSLVNLDHLRLVGSGRPTLFNVSNVIDPQTRRCENQGGWGEDEAAFSNRFLLIADDPRSCRKILDDRQGDLLIAESLPGKLRQDLLEVFEPVAARFTSRLGSEPGIVYVMWWPESPRSDARIESSWNRSTLLLFNGAHWEEGIPADQRVRLRDAFIREQTQRRIRETDQPGFFTSSAASYVQLLARAEYDGNMHQRLAAELPVWIARCASRLDGRPYRTASRPDVPGNDCGRLLEFVYDAVERAGSRGEHTVFDIWRKLLKDPALRRDGVPATAFLKSSASAARITNGLMQGSVDWQDFARELEKSGVQLRIRQDQLGVTAQLVSLEYFRN